MKLIESYSRQTSVPIKHKPFLLDKFFPLGNIQKYITIQNSSGMPAKNYDFYQESINLLMPIFNELKINIIQLGEQSAPQLNGVIDLRGKTSIHQTAYIVKNALLHLGNDSWLAHYAAANDINLVSLYGSTTIKNHSPYHFNPNKGIFLESNREGKLASFSREEYPKTINLITPEEVCRSICKLLDISFNYQFTTIQIGQNYNNKTLESCMDSVVDVKKINAENIVCRLDINYNLVILQHQMNLCGCQIVTDKEIPEQILQQFKPRILGVVYKVTTNHNPKFIKNLIKNKIGYQLISDLSTEELNKIKLDYLNYGIISQITSDKPKKLENKNYNNLYLKTSKVLFGNNKFYNSFYAYVNDIVFDPMKNEPIKIIDKNTELLWRDEPFCMFLEKN